MSDINKVTYQRPQWMGSETWGVETWKDIDYQTLTVKDGDDETIVPTDIQRINTLYVLTFNQKEWGTATFVYE